MLVSISLNTSMVLTQRISIAFTVIEKNVVFGKA